MRQRDRAHGVDAVVGSASLYTVLMAGGLDCRDQNANSHETDRHRLSGSTRDRDERPESPPIGVVAHSSKSIRLFTRCRLTFLYLPPRTMQDLWFVLLIVMFAALMFGLIAGCASLGARK